MIADHAMTPKFVKIFLRAHLAIPLEAVTTYLAGALQTMLLWWLDRKMPYSPERMDEMFQQLVMPGVNAALQI